MVYLLANVRGTHNTAQAAIDATHKVKPDLILTDIILPDIPGLEVTRMLKSDPELEYIPVVAVIGADIHHLAAHKAPGTQSN